MYLSKYDDEETHFGSHLKGILRSTRHTDFQNTAPYYKAILGTIVQKGMHTHTLC